MENKVLAIVNGTEVTEQSLKEIAMRYPADRQRYLLSEAGKKQLLEQVISFELIGNYAVDNGMENDAEYLTLLQRAKKEIITQVAINKILSEVTLTEEEVKKYYEANQDMFKAEESVRAKHILVDSLEKAEEVNGAIEAGMTFEEAASLYSSCPSKAQGGDLGSFTRGRMVPEFEKAAFELEVGVVSEPVQTQFGYHLIKVEEKEAGSIRPFEEVKNTISNELLSERQNFKYMQFVDELKKKYNVEVK